jgi:spore coat protein H
VTGPGSVTCATGADKTAVCGVNVAGRWLVLGALAGCSPQGGNPASPNDHEPSTTEQSEARYDPDHLTVMQGTLDEQEWEDLLAETRLFYELILAPDCLLEPIPNVFTYHPGSVTVDGETLSEVGFRKKGLLGSLSWTRPSLKVDSDRFVDGQEFGDGTEHFTFNNNNQDPSRLHTCLAYQVFRAAGVPAPLCAFATVEINGEDLGVYSNVQPIKKPFLRANFGNDDGDLYEGAVSDFNDDFLATFEIKSDGSTLGPLEELAQALELDDDVLMDRLSEILDVQGFVTFWAVEGLIGHWDGYAQGGNNFYLYHASDDGLLHFIPWGADAVLEDPSTDPLYSASLVAQRLWNHPEGQAAYLDETQRLLDEVWDEAHLAGEVDRMEALIRPHLLDDQEGAEHIELVRAFVEGRRGTVQELLDGPPDRPMVDKPRACVEPIGSVQSTFSVPWGTLDDDPFSAAVSLSGDLLGEPWVHSLVGGVAGIDENEGPLLALVGIDSSFTELVQVVLLLPPGIEPGTHGVDVAAVVGAVIRTDLTDPLDPGEMVGLLGGEVVFDAVSLEQGGTITGQLDAIVIPNIFE